MDIILDHIGFSIKWTTGSRYDDDFSDRLAYRFTSILLVCFAFLVSAKEFVGDPINCWSPAHFSGSQEDYTNSYCWIRNTYYLNFDEDVPAENEERVMVTYYQWIPMILLIQVRSIEGA